MRTVQIILINFLTFFIVAGYAQEKDARDRMQIGLKAGINSSNVYDEVGDDFEADPMIGFAGGVFLSIPIGTYLGVRPELLFSQKGYTASGKIETEKYDYKRRTNYIEVPILGEFKPVEFLTIVAGPQYSFMINKNDKFNVGTITPGQQLEISNIDLRKNTLGILVGADININYLIVSGRLGWDLQHNNGDGTSVSPRYKNIWVQATIGFRLPGSYKD